MVSAYQKTNGSYTVQVVPYSNAIKLRPFITHMTSLDRSQHVAPLKNLRCIAPGNIHEASARKIKNYKEKENKGIKFIILDI